MCGGVEDSSERNGNGRLIALLGYLKQRGIGQIVNEIHCQVFTSEPFTALVRKDEGCSLK